MAQPGSQLAKAGKPRRVRASGCPGATASPGNVRAGDVVLTRECDNAIEGICTEAVGMEARIIACSR